MQTLTQQLQNGTLTQKHLNNVSLFEVKKIYLAYKMELLELEMKKDVKNWNFISFLKIEIATLTNYLKLNNHAIS
jgi:hypothetical protein